MRFLAVKSSGLLGAGLVGVVACSGDSFQAAPSGTAGSGGMTSAGTSAGGSGDAGTSAGGTTSAGAAGIASAGTGGADSGGNAGAGGSAPQGGTSGDAGAGAGGDAGGAGVSSGGANGGVAGKGGSAGSAGSAGVSCSSVNPCADDRYCNRETQLCESCDDLSRIVLGTPVEALPTGTEGGYFPRVARLGGQFFLSFRRGADTPKGELFAVSAPQEVFTTAKADLLGAPISDPTAHESGFFLLNDGTKGSEVGAQGADMSDGSFRYALFDSNRGAKDQEAGRRRIFVARLPKDGNGSPAIVEQLGPGVNGQPKDVGEDNSAVYAPKSKRLYWMRVRNDGFQQVNAVMTKLGNSVEPPTEVELPDPACGMGAIPIAGNYGPWVTPDGRHLFYHRGCQTTVPLTAGSSTYYAALDDTGTKIVGPAKRLDTSGGVVSLAAGYHRTPSLSPNQCSMYFEREGKLMVAPRE